MSGTKLKMTVFYKSETPAGRSADKTLKQNTKALPRLCILCNKEAIFEHQPEATSYPVSQNLFKKIVSTSGLSVIKD